VTAGFSRGETVSLSVTFRPNTKLTALGCTPEEIELSLSYGLQSADLRLGIRLPFGAHDQIILSLATIALFFFL
jgi:hypothetical protein